MFEQLIELLKMQKELDESILKKRGIAEYPESNIKVALFVELGEMMNEFPSRFKHWKKQPQDNRFQGLMEYVDALHFALSLLNRMEADPAEVDEKLRNADIYKECSDIKWNRLEMYLEAVSADLSTDDYVDLLFDMFALGNEFGFTWEEIYQTYKAKNAINYQRLKNGY